MPRTIVTGANSFVAAHMIDRLIADGHQVVGTVRRDGVAKEILEAHPEWKNNLTIEVIPDYADQANWDKLFQGTAFDHVVHVAAPMVDKTGDNNFDDDFLKPAVEGNLALLRSAHKHAPTLKSISVTGSMNAVTTGAPDELKGKTLSNETWLPLSPDDARAANNAYYWYCSSKKEGEKAIWSFVETEKPTFAVTVFLPALIFGPPIEPVKNAKSLHYSSGIIYSFFNGTYDKIPNTTFPAYIDVRDLATAHVKALTTEGARNKRFVLGGMTMTYTDMVRSLAKVPALEGRLPAESGEDANVITPTLDASEANEVLKMKFRTLDETMKDAAERILELEKLN